MVGIKVYVVVKVFPVSQRWEVRGEVHVVDVVPGLPPPPAAAWARPGAAEPVRVDAGQEGDVCRVHQLGDSRVLNEWWSL